ncbi:glycolate oxidase subunit GlcF [Undibacterium arcticum]
MKFRKKQAAGRWPQRRHARKMLLLDGCVQPAMAPNINSAAARVLDALEVEVLIAAKAGCCGAIRYHLNDQDGGLDDMRRNIDAWWPYVDASNGQEIEAIVMTASGCGVTVKEYGHLLAGDAAYAEKKARKNIRADARSERNPACVRDPIARQARWKKISKRVAYHPPCTLQHGQQIRGKVEGLLRSAGVDVQLCADSHLCCGSAGTYSVLQPELSYQLRDNKLRNLQATQPDMIVSANIGCLTHLQSGTATPVQHWIELLDQALQQPPEQV